MRELQNQISPGVQTRLQARVSDSPERVKPKNTRRKGAAKKKVQRAKSRKAQATHSSESGEEEEEKESPAPSKDDKYDEDFVEPRPRGQKRA